MTNIPVKINFLSKICDLSEAYNYTDDDIKKSFIKAVDSRKSANKIKSTDTTANIPVSEILNNVLENSGERAIQRIELMTEGKMTYSGGKYTVVYEENEESGMQECQTTLYFDENERDNLTIVRDGDSKMSLVFKADKRRYCQYEFGMGLEPMELVTVTHQIVNSVDQNGGFIAVDYTIETLGRKIMFNSMRIRVRTVKVVEDNSIIRSYEK